MRLVQRFFRRAGGRLKGGQLALRLAGPVLAVEERAPATFLASEAVAARATFEALQQAAGSEFVGELVDTFLSEAPLMQQDLRAALAASKPGARVEPGNVSILSGGQGGGAKFVQP